MKIKKCVSCGSYTFGEKCDMCGAETVKAAPPRFSPQDPYGEYRRKMKKLDN